MKKGGKAPISAKKSGTIIRRCACKHAFQDRHYGLGMRLCNITNKDGSRCTVCGKEDRIEH
jgi:hypothetical protein